MAKTGKTTEATGTVDYNKSTGGSTTVTTGKGTRTRALPPKK